MYEVASFGAQTSSVRRARRWLVDHLGPGSSARSDDAQLCLSELAANCVRHTSSDFTVEISDRGGPMRLAVRDHDNLLPILGRAASGDPTGRGLAIVAAVSDRWGVEPHHPDGKSVWCEFGEPAPRTPGGSPAPGSGGAGA